MHSINGFLADHFRCPEGQVDFRCPPAGHSGQGYFRFGTDLVCYAQSGDLPLARTADASLHDALKDLRLEGSRWVLPFDPAQAIDDLRREHYVQNAGVTGEGKSIQRFIRSVYYGGRPLLPVTVRKHLQRMYLARRRATGFPHWPVDFTVDRLFENLLALSMRAQGVDRIPFVWFWPEGHSSAAIMTHDVETEGGLQACPALTDLDEDYGIRSSFQFIPENRYTTPPSLLADMRRRGFEINIHDLNHDGRLYWSRKEFVRRAAKINFYAREYGARGFRAAVLYRNLDWYDALDLSYDMSVPNVGHLSAQPGGCCTVMPFFIDRILELPLTTAEDYLLFQILGQYSTDLWQLQIQLIQDAHGLITFLTHPDYLDDHRARETYRVLLAQLSHLRADNGLWIALPGEVDEWWRARSQMTLEQQDGAWRIQGPGSERGRVAYAHLNGDGVRYTIDNEAVASPCLETSIRCAGSVGVAHGDAKSPVTARTSKGARPSPAQTGKAIHFTPSARSEFPLHGTFAVLCALSAIALASPLAALARLAYHSEYYTHTVVIPLLAACAVFLKRRSISAGSKPRFGLSAPLLTAGILLFISVRWSLPSLGSGAYLSLAILSLVLFWMGSFAFCYGDQAFRAVLLPMLLLLLMVPLPMSVMDAFLHVTRVGSVEVASRLLSAFGVPVFHEGFLLVFPGLSIEVAKDCSGIHSTIALFVLTLLCAYLFLPTKWKGLLLLLCVFPIVSLTNGLRITTLCLLAEYVNRNILHSSLHRDGGILFFLLAFSLMAGVLRLLSMPHTLKDNIVTGQQTPLLRRET